MPRRARSSGDQRVLNNIAAGLLLFLLALSPLPFASVSPVMSAVWACLLGLLGLGYFLLLVARGERLRFSLRRVGFPALAIGVVLFWLVVQTLPVGEFSISLPNDAVKLESSTISIAPGLTLLMLGRQLTYGLFALLVLQVSVNDGRRAALLRITLCVVLAYALYGMIALHSGDTILGQPKWAYLGAATGPMVNRNSFATYLGIGAVLALAMIAARLIDQADRHKDDGRIANNTSTIILLGLAYAFILVVIISTQSRMGLAATLAGSAVVVLLTLATLRNKRLSVGVALALFAILALGLVFFGHGLFDRLGSVESSSEVRSQLYQQTWELIMARPWTGFGGGTFELAFPLVQHAPISPDLVWERAHNTYLALWADLGLVAGSLPILAIAVIGWTLLRNVAARRGSWRSQIAAIGVIVLGSVHSLSDFSLEIPAVTLLYIAVISIGLAGSKSALQSRAEATNA